MSKTFTGTVRHNDLEGGFLELVTQGGDVYRLNGRKLWISNAAEAGLFIVFATIDASARHRGVTAFIVERDMPGFSVGRKEMSMRVHYI